MTYYCEETYQNSHLLSGEVLTCLLQGKRRRRRTRFFRTDTEEVKDIPCQTHLNDTSIIRHIERVAERPGITATLAGDETEGRLMPYNEKTGNGRASRYGDGPAGVWRPFLHYIRSVERAKSCTTSIQTYLQKHLLISNHTSIDNICTSFL